MKNSVMALGRISGDEQITVQPNWEDGTVRLSYTRTVSVEEARKFYQRELEPTTVSVTHAAIQPRDAAVVLSVLAGRN